VKVHGLGRGLAFALFAGLGTLPWQLCWVPYLGYGSAFGSYMLLITLVALPWHAPSLSRALGAAALGALVLLPTAFVAPTPLPALLVALCMLGVGRSGIAYPRPFARALALELPLGLMALCFSLLLYDASLFGAALASWGFWLVQSLFSLAPGRVSATTESTTDPFDQARAAAEQLMHGQ
jgi:hypothetical protein